MNEPRNKRLDLLCLGLFLSLGFIVVLHSSVSEANIHFKIFINASREFFANTNPYGRSFQDSGGFATLWLYSPTTAIIFYPLTLIPTKLALFSYLFISWLLYLYGLFSFAKIVWGRLGLGGSAIYWAVLSSELIGSLQAAKIEVFMTGLALISFAKLAEGKWKRLSAFFLALLCNIKFLLLPSVGLLAAYLLASNRRAAFRWTGAFALSLIGLYALPFLFFDSTLVLEAHKVWFQSLSHSAEQTWRSYQSLYAFSAQHLSYPENIIQLKILGAVMSLMFLLLALWARHFGTSMTLVLGSAYSLLFLPMTQSSSFILATPLILFFRKLNAKYEKLTLAAYWFLASLLYSDLVPNLWRQSARSFNLKPLALLLFFLALLIAAQRSAHKKMTPPLNS